MQPNATSDACDALPKLFADAPQALASPNCVLCLRDCAIETELKPISPRTVSTDTEKKVDVIVTRSLDWEDFALNPLIAPFVAWPQTEAATGEWETQYWVGAGQV